MKRDQATGLVFVMSVSLSISQSVTLSSNNLDKLCNSLPWQSQCALLYLSIYMLPENNWSGSISCTWSHSFMYTYVNTFKKVKVVCQASLVEEKELFKLQIRCNCCYKYTQCNLFYTEMHENFSANKTHKLTLVKTEYETWYQIIVTSLKVSSW